MSGNGIGRLPRNRLCLLASIVLENERHHHFLHSNSTDDYTETELFFLIKIVSAAAFWV